MAAGPPEAWCWQVLRERRWPKGVVCAYCHAGRVERHRQCGPAAHYRCRRCRRMFSDLTGTPFEKTKAPLSAWFVAIDLMQSEASIPVGRLAQMISVNRKTGRMILKKVSAFGEDPLIRSIGVDLVLWKWTHDKRPDILGRDGKKKEISDILAEMPAFPEAGSTTHI